MQNTDTNPGILWLFYVSLCPGVSLGAPCYPNSTLTTSFNHLDIWAVSYCSLQYIEKQRVVGLQRFHRDLENGRME